MSILCCLMDPTPVWCWAFASQWSNSYIFGWINQIFFNFPGNQTYFGVYDWYCAFGSKEVVPGLILGIPAAALCWFGFQTHSSINFFWKCGCTDGFLKGICRCVTTALQSEEWNSWEFVIWDGKNGRQHKNLPRVFICDLVTKAVQLFTLNIIKSAFPWFFLI